MQDIKYDLLIFFESLLIETLTAMNFFDLLKEPKFLMLFLMLIISVSLNTFQLFINLRKNNLKYSTVAFRNMILTSIALLFIVPISEGVLRQFGIVLSQDGLISGNTKDIYFYAMMFFCTPYIVLVLGEQFKWFVIIYIATVFRGAASSIETLRTFKEIIQIVLFKESVHSYDSSDIELNVPEAAPIPKTDESMNETVHSP